MPIHITAKPEDIAEYVLLPGDPERAEYIAQTFFEQPKCYTSYRKMYGFTGTYKNISVSVQTTGMGTPSTSIIVEELIQLGAKNLIRVGTCGGLQANMNFTDIVIALTAWGSREIVKEITEIDMFVPAVHPDLLLRLHQICQEKKITSHIGAIGTENLFYRPNRSIINKYQELGCLALEMEAAALFSLSAYHKIRSACLLCVSDLLHDPQYPTRTSNEEILKGINNIVETALDCFVSLDHNAKRI